MHRSVRELSIVIQRSGRNRIEDTIRSVLVNIFDWCTEGFDRRAAYIAIAGSCCATPPSSISSWRARREMDKDHIGSVDYRLSVVGVTEDACLYLEGQEDVIPG